MTRLAIATAVVVLALAITAAFPVMATSDPDQPLCNPNIGTYVNIRPQRALIWNSSSGCIALEVPHAMAVVPEVMTNAGISLVSIASFGDGSLEQPCFEIRLGLTREPLDSIQRLFDNSPQYRKFMRRWRNHQVLVFHRAVRKPLSSFEGIERLYTTATNSHGYRAVLHFSPLLSPALFDGCPRFGAREAENLAREVVSSIQLLP